MFFSQPIACNICATQITMATAWLLLLLVVSSQSVDSQPTTDDDKTCDGDELPTEQQTDVERIVENQQQLFQAIMNRLGKYRIRTIFAWGFSLLTLSLTRWLYCVECPQYSIRLEALGYLRASCLLAAFDAT